jgi:hypothetical protein
MNTIPFNDQPSFPLAADDLQNMQEYYKRIATALGTLLGGNAIISGCTVSGAQISAGVVFLNSELLPFQASVYNSNESLNYMHVVETETTRTTTEGTFVVLKERYARVTTATSSIRFGDLMRVGYLADLATKIDKVVEPRGAYSYLSVNNQYVNTGNLVCQVDDLSNVHIRGAIVLKATGQSNGANAWMTLFNVSAASGLTAERRARILPQAPWSNYEGVMIIGYQPIHGLVVKEYRFMLTKEGDFRLHTESNTDIFNNAYTTNPIYINVMYNNPLGTLDGVQ